MLFKRHPEQLCRQAERAPNEQQNQQVAPTFCLSFLFCWPAEHLTAALACVEADNVVDAILAETKSHGSVIRHCAPVLLVGFFHNR
jgi:hypothetical protein